jgi:outer membrane protein assembly factor BamB
MHKAITRAAVAVAAAAALSALGMTGAGTSGAATRAGQPAGHAAVTASGAAAVPGTQLWVKRYSGPGGPYGADNPQSMAISPGGDTVFVTGQSPAASMWPDYATIAYDAATGARLWVQRYNGPASRYDSARSVAVSPTGDVVFVTGESTGTAKDDYATIGYNAATGARLWVQRYNGPGNGRDSAESVAVSPGGDTVFVTGISAGSTGTTSKADYATIAYNAATGARLWVQRYNGPGNGNDAAQSVAVSPGGDTVFVTGSSAERTGTNSKGDYATVAYSAATGAQLWVQRYNGPSNGNDQVRSMAVSPRGEAVFVTGYNEGLPGVYDYATVAYSAATGARLWVQHYAGGVARSVAVSPSADAVFVTGWNGGDYATIAYNAASGAQLWVQRYDGPENSQDSGASVAVSPGGDTVFVTGDSREDYATVAYDAASGAQLWVQRYSGPSHDYGEFVAVSPTGDRVFVTGDSVGGTSSYDYVTIAYSS